MKPLYRRLAIAAAVLIIIKIAVLYTMGNRLAIALVSHASNTTITYRHVSGNSLGELRFTDLGVTDRKSGIGFLAKKAVVKPSWKEILGGKIWLDYAMSDVGFIKRNAETQSGYETFEDLLALPFKSEWVYYNVTGRLRASNGDIYLKDLTAANDMIKFSITGDFRGDANVDSDITLYFSEKLFAKIPKKFTKGVLKDEGGGWQSISMKLTGNYNAPSIQVTGQQFRLRIGTTQ